MSKDSLKDYNNECWLWKWAKHIEERLAETKKAERIGLIRDKLRDFQRVGHSFPETSGKFRLLNDLLPPSMKYEIADSIVTESRSKPDIVQDVWDELMQRGLTREPKRESGERPKTKDLLDVIRMKLERRFQVADYLQDGFQEDPPARAVVTDVCQDIMAHVREIHALAERAINGIEGEVRNV